MPTTPHRKQKQQNFRVKWQTEADTNHTKQVILLPNNFLLLCRLMELTPETLLQDFAQNLSCGSWKREGRDEAKAHLLNYFIAHGYGRHLYTNGEIQQLFKEMDALGLLFPYNGNIQLVKQYAAWRTKHSRYWFKKWQTKAHGKSI